MNKTNKPPSPKAPRERPIIAAPAMWMTFVEAAGPAVLALLSADVTSAADVDASALVEAGVGHRGDVAEGDGDRGLEHRDGCEEGESEETHDSVAVEIGISWVWIELGVSEGLTEGEVGEKCGEYRKDR